MNCSRCGKDCSTGVDPLWYCNRGTCAACRFDNMVGDGCLTVFFLIATITALLGVVL